MLHFYEIKSLHDVGLSTGHSFNRERAFVVPAEAVFKLGHSMQTRLCINLAH